MAIDFPNSPTNGDTYSTASKTWTYASATTSWTLVPSYNQNILTTTVSDKSANYTVIGTDDNSVIRSTASTAITLTLGTGLAIGDRVDFIQDGAGQITFAAGSGITLVSKGTALKTTGQYSGVSVICVASGQYRLIGDLTA